jgi:hypothetical protein
MQFMRDELDEVAEVCEWESITAPAYQKAVNAMLRTAKAETIDQINADHIELLARVEIWRRVVNKYSMAIDFTADGLTAKNGDLFDNAQKMLDRALAEARKVGYYVSFALEAQSTARPIRFTF